MVSEQDIGWLAGFFDGEGCITVGGSASHRQVRLQITNTDKALLEKAQSILDALEIDSIIKPAASPLGCKAKWRLWIENGAGVKAFFKKVPIQSQDKFQKYAQVVPLLPTRTKGHTRLRRQRLARQHPQLL
jgi:intein-encoded DNA endonuclease-like protein